MCKINSIVNLKIKCYSNNAFTKSFILHVLEKGKFSEYR